MPKSSDVVCGPAGADGSVPIGAEAHRLDALSDLVDQLPFDEEALKCGDLDMVQKKRRLRNADARSSCPISTRANRYINIDTKMYYNLLIQGL